MLFQSLYFTFNSVCYLQFHFNYLLSLSVISEKLFLQFFKVCFCTGINVKTACRKSLDLGSCKTWTWSARPIPFRAHGATPLHTLPHCGYFCSRQEWAKHGITFHRFLKAVCVLEPPLTRSIDWDKQGCWVTLYTAVPVSHTFFMFM